MKIGAAQNTAFAFIPLFTDLQTRNEKHKFIAEAFVRLVMRIERPANLALQNYAECTLLHSANQRASRLSSLQLGTWEGLNRVKKINRQPSKKVNYDRKPSLSPHELLGSEGSFETFQDPKTCLYMKIFRNFTC